MVFLQPAGGAIVRFCSIAFACGLCYSKNVHRRGAGKERQVEKDGTDFYYVKVAQDEEGKVIGRQGRVAKAIKALCKALGAKKEEKLKLYFLLNIKKVKLTNKVKRKRIKCRINLRLVKQLILLV